MRVFAANPLVPTGEFGGPQRALSADFTSAAVLIPAPPGSWVTQIGIWNRSTGVTTRLTDLDQTTFAMGQPYMSADGSKIFFQHMYSRIDPADPDDLEAGVMRIDVASGVIDPISFGRSTGILGYSVAGDGNTVLAKSGWAAMVWRNGQLSTLGTGTTSGTQYSVQEQSLSTNGRYAAIPTSTPIGGGLQQAGLTVFDLQQGTVHATWTGPTRLWNPQIIANPDEFLLRVGNTLDDGSVVFTQGIGGPLLRLDGATGATSPTVVAEAFVDAGSANGRHVIFRGAASSDFAEQTLDLWTDAVDDAHLATTPGGSWRSVAVSDDGERILVHGTDIDHVDGYYLWERHA